jgi:hypothetical protein
VDNTVLAFLAAAFVVSLILAGIHAYHGVRVVERGVIFVDLSLAQIAALGATIAILLPINGGDPHSAFSYWVSLAFTFLGAFIFSTIRSRRARIPQEAIIGICYVDRSPAGPPNINQDRRHAPESCHHPCGKPLGNWDREGRSTDGYVRRNPRMVAGWGWLSSCSGNLDCR